MASTPDVDPEIIIIDDKDEEKSGTQRSHSPWESELLPKVKARISKDRSLERHSSRDRNRRSRERDYR